MALGALGGEGGRVGLVCNRRAYFNCVELKFNPLVGSPITVRRKVAKKHLFFILIPPVCCVLALVPAVLLTTPPC